MHFISFYIFFSLSTHSIELALASFVCLPTAAAAADQLVVCYFFISFSLVSCVCVCVWRGYFFFHLCVHFCAHSSCHRRTRWSCLFSWTLVRLVFSLLLLLHVSVIVWAPTAPLCSSSRRLLLLLKWNLCVCAFGGFRVKPNWFLLVWSVMGLLRTMTVLRVHPASPPHHDSSAGSWNKRMRHLSSPVLYLTALLA